MHWKIFSYCWVFLCDVGVPLNTSQLQVFYLKKTHHYGPSYSRFCLWFFCFSLLLFNLYSISTWKTRYSTIAGVLVVVTLVLFPILNATAKINYYTKQVEIYCTHLRPHQQQSVQFYLSNPGYHYFSVLCIPQTDFSSQRRFYLGFAFPWNQKPHR